MVGQAAYDSLTDAHSVGNLSWGQWFFRKRDPEQKINLLSRSVL